MMDLIAGRVHDIRVHVRERTIDAGLIGSYDEDAAFRGRVKAWMNGLWRDKDAQAARMQPPTAGVGRGD